MIKNKEIKKGARILLGAALAYAGTSHLTFARRAFQAQVPNWVPLKKDDTVVYSGIVEIALGAALLFTPQKYQKTVGEAAAAFFIAVLPGNIAQYMNRRNSFGLNTDRKRFARLFFQPILVYWALKSTNITK